jgi:lipoyl-dependent peroxiredoxin
MNSPNTALAAGQTANDAFDGAPVTRPADGIPSHLSLSRLMIGTYCACDREASLAANEQEEDLMSANVVYTTSAVAVGGRDGITGTTDGKFEVKLARPKEFGGRGDGNNPEQLFASGYAASFLSSMAFLASKGGPVFPPDAEVMVTVGLRPRSEGGLGLEVALDIVLPGLARAEAETLIGMAHQTCPYSNAMRDNVAVRLGMVEA